MITFYLERRISLEKSISNHEGSFEFEDCGRDNRRSAAVPGPFICVYSMYTSAHYTMVVHEGTHLTKG